MDSKFYVSLEAARLLREKGYNEYCNYYYTDKEEQIYYNRGAIKNYEYKWTLNIYTAPSKAEAIDWLDSKGYRIIIIYDWIECKWYFKIINGSPTIKNITELEVSDSVLYKTRLEAEDAAIIKALELLKKGE